MLGPCHMKGEVLVAEPEPIVAAEPFHVLDEIPAFLRASPTPLLIAEVSERVKNGVDVGANPQAQMFEIITDVDDDRRRPGLGNPLQSQGKFRSAPRRRTARRSFFFSWVMTPAATGPVIGTGPGLQGGSARLRQRMGAPFKSPQDYHGTSLRGLSHQERRTGGNFVGNGDLGNAERPPKTDPAY